MTASTVLPTLEDSIPRPHGRGLDLVTRRSLLSDAVEMGFALAPGDRPLVTVGDTIVPGTTIAERLRDAHLTDVPLGSIQGDPAPGDRWTASGQSRVRRTPHPGDGELLFSHHAKWSAATGEHVEPVDCPIAGMVREIRPGIGIRVQAQGRALPGVEALGDPTSGRLSLGSDRGDVRHGRLRSTSLDVGLAGTILVIGSRVDAEALTRARAMGVRGVVVSGLAGKERRDFLASESRQRAALHRLPPFAVLILDGVIRRPIAGPIAAILEALAGRTVAISVDPPALVFDVPEIEIAAPPSDHVRVRSGEHAGEEGRWAGLAGNRRFAGGTFLEAGWVIFGDDPPLPVPLADLERFV
ncbi:MAG TPA: hypothetical protein VH440_07925 [Candidatus Limnocylindrales bacterium]|jgi:hypothetical protein